VKKLVISNSMLRSLGTCSTQAWLRTNGFSARLESEKDAPARAGRDAHVSFEKWHRGGSPDECVQAFLDLYRPFSDKYLLDKNRYHHENLARILHVFFATNPLSTLPYEVVETERQIELSLGVENEIEFIVSDKSDGLGRMRDSGDFYPIECKTVSWLGPDYVRDYDLDSQITTHVEAWRRNGVDAKGVILQAINFNKLPDPGAVTLVKKTGEYRSSTCRTAGHGPVSDCWSQHVNFQRFVVTRSEQDIETWLRNVEKRIKDYQFLLEGTLKEAPQEGLFGHCGKCEFLAFCKGHRANLEQLFKREREEGILYSGFHGTNDN
jgi:CRISPR/Cas system-associated exonuclease Cas4 (RecB family)